MTILDELRDRLREINAHIDAYAREREAVRQEITREKARRQLQLQNAVLARWESGMTSPEIAAALGATVQTVEHVMDEWRAANAVTVRRGRTNPERRRVRDKRPPKRKSEPGRSI